jgi:enamine deaminase RidA (YjgF/YER057c/UK114 family)
MRKDSLPFGGAMGMKIAFCNGIGIQTREIKRLIWIFGQIAFDENGLFVGKGDIRVQTEQVLRNIKSVVERLGGTMDDIGQVSVFVKNMSGLKDIRRPWPILQLWRQTTESSRGPCGRPVWSESIKIFPPHPSRQGDIRHAPAAG